VGIVAAAGWPARGSASSGRRDFPCSSRPAPRPIQPPGCFPGGGGGKQLRRCRLPLKCNGTRAEIRFRLSAKQTSPFKSAGVSVQSTTGSRGVRISGSIAVYTISEVV
jgi:hypothetical protein